MSLPEWAEEVIAAHSIFEEAGVELDVRWNAEGERVESVCHDIPPFIFPARSWYVGKKTWGRGLVIPHLHMQLEYIQEYLNAN